MSLKPPYNDSVLAAMRHVREQLEWADGGYKGWTDEEVLTAYLAFTDETDC